MSGKYWESLSRRRKALRMSFPALSDRTGVSVPALKQIFSGHRDNPTLQTIQAIATALGVEIRINEQLEIVDQSTAFDFRKRAAEEKAERLVRLVQGTSALESQAVDPTDLRAMVKQTVYDLMAGPSKRIWAP
jgi:transcriptional regulator with XRE-family HTH domain